jgi:hypothetical protein
MAMTARDMAGPNACLKALGDNSGAQVFGKVGARQRLPPQRPLDDERAVLPQPKLGRWTQMLDLP